MDFKEKNRLRREHSALARQNEGRGALREARRMRRVRHGAFGTAPAHLYNLMLVGTSQKVEREDKGDERIPVVTI